MQASLELRPGRCYLVLAPRPLGRSLMNSFAARLALAGAVQVLDGGNAFDALSIARQVRRQTADLEAALGRLRVARAFTCYQMVAMLGGQPASATPLLVLDLLTTFCDESVSLFERTRLLERALNELRRLSGAAPVAVSATPAPLGGAGAPVEGLLSHLPGIGAPAPAMLASLEQAADQVLRFTYPQDNAIQGSFW